MIPSTISVLLHNDGCGPARPDDLPGTARKKSTAQHEHETVDWAAFFEKARHGKHTKFSIFRHRHEARGPGRFFELSTQAWPDAEWSWLGPGPFRPTTARPDPDHNHLYFLHNRVKLQVDTKLMKWSYLTACNPNS